MSILSDEDKAKIDSMTEAELRYEDVKGRDSIYQGDKMARIQARLKEINARRLKNTNKVAVATLIVAAFGVLATILIAIFE